MKRGVFDVRGCVRGRRRRETAVFSREERRRGWEARGGGESGEKDSADVTMDGGTLLEEGGHLGEEGRGGDEPMSKVENDLIG